MTRSVPRDFAAFVEDHYVEVLRALSLAAGNRAVAEDATQEAFARALRHWVRVGGMERPAAWVYVVGGNLLRRRSRERSAAAGDAADTFALSDASERVVNTITLRAALDTLTERQRLVVVLRYLAGLSTAEVGDAMRCSPGTVKSTLHTALQKLRVELEEDEA